jgi:hypothetical protein
VGKLIFIMVGWGDAEGAGVERTGPLAELQAVMIINPNKNLNTSNNVFVIPHPWLLTISSTQRILTRVGWHERGR